jgi:hypothetical protein
MRIMSIALVLAASCEPGWHVTNYTPTVHPGIEPHGVIEAILARKPGCISRFRWAEQELRVMLDCNAETSTMYIAHFDHVKRIVVAEQNQGGLALVVLEHDDGSPEFRWQPANLADAGALADALTALAVSR